MHFTGIVFLNGIIRQHRLHKQLHPINQRVLITLIITTPTLVVVHQTRHPLGLQNRVLRCQS